MHNKRRSSIDPVARWAERQHWIRPEIERTAQGFIQSAFELLGEGGEPVRAFLQGDWLHEPLHAAVTDVPLGAWTVTTAMDGLAALTGRKELDAAADAALWVGLAGAGLAALSGMADWSQIEEAKPRRIGAVHALLNVGATALFGWSCLARRTAETRARGRALATLGYALVGISAHLGGSLVYEHGVGLRLPASGESDARATPEKADIVL